MRSRISMLVTAAVLCAAGSCAYDQTVEALQQQSPPPELGRPWWVTGPAAIGSYAGGAIGGVASIAILPVTWPVSLLAEEPLGYSKDEFLFALLGAGASGGHFLLGSPFDVVDYSVRRAWTNEGRLVNYRFEEQPPPVGPVELGRGDEVSQATIDAPAPVAPGPSSER